MDRPSETAPRPRRGLFVLYLLIAVGLLSAGYLFRGELVSLLHSIERVVQQMGSAAPVGMAIVSGIWGVFCLPGPLMQGAIATMFSTNPWIALAVAIAGETIAQSVAFEIARRGGRDKVRQQLSGRPWFQKLELETARGGAQGVFLFRLMPFFPNALASYAFGLTGLRFVPYLGASIVGTIPKLFMYVFGTTSLVNWLRSGLLTPRALGLSILALGVLTLLARLWQKRLRKNMEKKS